MGTRCDFYVGRGQKAKWIGSVAYDGFPEDFEAIITAKTEAGYVRAVEKELSSRDDSTFAAEGWPWPWDDSGLTDYSIAWDKGAIYWTDYGDNGKVWHQTGRRATWPNMASKRNLAYPGTSRSGIMIVGKP
jgi:hypothetical protein